MPRLLQLLDETLDLIFAPQCVVCRKSRKLREGICRECEVLWPIKPPLCLKCGNPRSQKILVCGTCLKGALHEARSAYWLTENTGTLWHRVKHEGWFSLLPWVEQICPRFTDMTLTDAVLIPVPLAPKRLLTRGFNQAEWLAAVLSKNWNVPLLTHRLRKTREATPQSVLGRKDRQSNLKGAYSWTAPTIPKAAILIDDIYTTGATLNTCAETLKAHGIARVSAFTLFRTPLKA